LRHLLLQENRPGSLSDRFRLDAAYGGEFYRH
jgi:hypothetical protein